MVEAAVGEGAAEALVEEQEQERDLDAFGTEAVGIAAAVAFEQAMTFQLAQVVAELIQSVGFGGKLEGGEHGLVNLFGRPAADGGAAMQEDFHQANDPRFMDFDSGIADGADGDGQGQTLQQREIHMDVEPLRLAIGETIGNDLESFAHGIEMIEPLLQAEIAQIVGNTVRCAGTGRTFHTA